MKIKIWIFMLSFIVVSCDHADQVSFDQNEVSFSPVAPSNSTSQVSEAASGNSESQQEDQFPESDYDLLQVNFPSSFTNFFNTSIPLIDTNIYIKKLKRSRLFDPLSFTSGVPEGTVNKPQFDQRFNDLSQKVRDFEIIEGYLLMSQNLSDLIQINNKPLYVSLVRDRQTQLLYGVVEWLEGQALYFYGNKVQIESIGTSKNNISGYDQESLKKYNAVLTDEFRASYNGQGLQYIFGSYLVQKYVFYKNFKIKLELNNLTYVGPELEYQHNLPTNTFAERQAVQAKYLDDLNLLTSSFNNYSQASFVVWYKVPIHIRDFLGPVLGLTYIDASCNDLKKTLFVQPYGSVDEPGQYNLDSHEMAHSLGAIHLQNIPNESNTDERYLMSERPRRTNAIVDFGLANSEYIMASKYRTDSNGNCHGSTARSGKSYKLSK